jgi:pimeloyl-ACP methyl ester carboxylesterase
MTIGLVHGNPETAAIWGRVTTLSPPGFGAPTPEGWDPNPASYVAWLASELEKLEGPIDLVGHDWGAGHVYGLLATRPDLVRSWACDCAGLIHPEYVWHDMAQVWQTPDAGEEAVEAIQSLSSSERQAMFERLGMTANVAADLAEAAGDLEMGRCVLGLYRTAVQPTLKDLGMKLAKMELPPGLILDATDDVYVGSELAPQMVESLGASHLPLDGQGHWWMISAPEVAAKGLSQFWAGLA